VTEVEDLSSKKDAYWVVHKTDEAGEYIEGPDPRSR
jgi:hypothetical protein